MFVMLVVGIVLGAPGDARADGGWNVTAFSGQLVSLVRVNRRHPDEVMAVADGRLKLTRDGGVVWSDVNPPSFVHAAAFDPVNRGWMVVATDLGLYQSQNFGGSWQRLDQILTARKIGVAIFETDQYIMALLWDGAGTPVRLYRFDRSGQGAELAYPFGGATAIDYDSASRRLFMATAGGVMVSDNQGLSWSALPGSPAWATAVVVRGTQLYVASDDGVYRSIDGGQSWNRLVRAGDINGTYYGSDMHFSGLAEGSGRLYYGAYSIGFPYHFLVGYNGGSAASELNLRVYDVASEDIRVWVGGADGLRVMGIQAGSAIAALPIRPVVVIPGILGSWPVPLGLLNSYASYLPEPAGANYHSGMVLDPIAHTYDGLIKSLAAAGYQEGATLFSFPYQWRQDNRASGHQLMIMLQDVRRQCSCSQVDVVAHSMGGLVARSYIQSGEYQGDVRNLIMVGTPNAGALGAYGRWEGGQISDQPGVLGAAAQAATQLEAFHHGYLQLVEYIRREVPSVGQLLPVFNYLDGRTYPSGYPVNQFLEDLNSGDGLSLLRRRATLYAVGSNSLATPRSYTVGGQSASLLWPHGRVLGTGSGPGDSTVLASSLEGAISSSGWFAGDHGSMLGSEDLQHFIFGTIIPEVVMPSPKQTHTVADRPSLVIYAKSPIRISVIDPQGRLIDDGHIQAPGAYYSGSQTDSQFMVIPEYLSGSYRILVTPTASGQYGLGADEYDAQAQLLTHNEINSGINSTDDIEYVYDASRHRLRRLTSGTVVDNKSTVIMSNVSASGFQKNLFRLAAGGRRDDKALATLGSRPSLDNHFVRSRNWLLLLLFSLGLVLVTWLRTRR